MTNLLKIPANSQAYLFAVRNEVADKFDVKKFAYDYRSETELPEPWAYWRFEETSGTRADSTSHGRDLTPQGNALPSYDTGLFGNCAKCVANGVDPPPRFYLAEFPSVTGNEPFTLEFWLKTNDLETDQRSYFRIEAWDDPDSYANILFELLADNPTWGNTNLFWKLEIGTYDEGYENWTGLTFEVNPTTHPWSDDAWHFVCIVYDGSSLCLYIDNELWGSVSGTHGIFSQLDRLRICAPRENGTINYSEEFGIWDAALTAEQRAYLWNDGTGRTLYP